MNRKRAIMVNSIIYQYQMLERLSEYLHVVTIILPGMTFQHLFERIYFMTSPYSTMHFERCTSVGKTQT